MCVPLPHEQDTNSADTAYEIVCLRILDFCTVLIAAHCLQFFTFVGYRILML
jgi:hypothetical protein